MDTRFWGPSGWKLLHLISFDYTYSIINASNYANFFETIPYILPCKYCRISLTDYYREHPFQVKNIGLSSTFDLKKWLYTIHNCVNHKLRTQGLYHSSNPSFAYVKKMYNKLLQCPWEQQIVICWDFLFAVAYHHPKEITRHELPISNCPKEVYYCKRNCEKNKWIVLPMKWRMYWFKRFWEFLPAVLPISINPHWKAAESIHPPILDSRHSTMEWLWKIRCTIDSSFQDPYTTICKKIAGYSSDCGHKKKGITCRRIKKQSCKRRKTIKKE